MLAACPRCWPLAPRTRISFHLWCTQGTPGQRWGPRHKLGQATVVFCDWHLCPQLAIRSCPYSCFLPLMSYYSAHWNATREQWECEITDIILCECQVHKSRFSSGTFRSSDPHFQSLKYFTGTRDNLFALLHHPENRCWVPHLFCVDAALLSSGAKSLWSSVRYH